MMPRQSSASWVAFVDVLLCFLVVIMVMVSSHKNDDAQVNVKVEYMITASWNIEKDDADVDLWVVPPPGVKPVYYGNKEVGLTNLDIDCLGWTNTYVVLADGSKASQKECRETVTVRGLSPGHFDVGIHLFRIGSHAGPIAVHVEAQKINPRVHTVYAGDFTLHAAKQSLNVFSMDVDDRGEPTLVDVPGDPITNRYYDMKHQDQ